ncbi:protein DpdE [Pseudomonadales bacterium]|nr:protein DpdE [Pseudomonadales bacterium]
MTPLIGNLVTSTEFDGIGKVYSVDEIKHEAVVSFFESPELPDSRQVTLAFELLSETMLSDEAVIYCINPLYGKWQRARYGGERPDGHLVIFRSGEQDVMSTADIYVINIGDKPYLDPRAYLSQRCCDTPLFQNHRSNFIRSYIEQRSACRSISSVLSSGIELEAYQLAVVRRVLQDDIKRYLLADEVGLGKTIEAGMIIRELMADDFSRKAIIAVPEALIEQWRSELTERFFLEPLLDEDILIICSHEELAGQLLTLTQSPKMMVIDEAHLIADRGWSDDLEVKEAYRLIAKVCEKSEVCLLLSGTPLNGNETNFLSMLHLLSPESYPLSTQGIENFKLKIAERESLGGIYQALTPSNDNTTLSELLDQIKVVVPSDTKLNQLIETATPLVDWLDGEEEGDDRHQAISDIRRYLGEHYRIHQRMLRNRRADPYIASLFPGLQGLETLTWSVDEKSLSVEQSLEAFRGEFLSTGTPTALITADNFRVWVEMALSNPLLLAERAANTLANLGGTENTFEVDALEELIVDARQEQEEKDFICLSYIQQWLDNNATGKIIVFAGNFKTASHIYSLLQQKFDEIVELHVPGRPAKFNEDNATRLLVCDERGEDGLNLHGGKKLVVHYDLPTSISRIEQRLGRVNRYSADIKASPVQSIAFNPQGDNFSSHWIQLLNNGVNIFNHSVASLQYVLEPHIEKAWNDISKVGVDSLVALDQEFTGENGLIVRESLKVLAQEQLNNLEIEINQAKDYSAEIIESDSQAELQANNMQGWLTEGLRFRRKQGEEHSTFRYEYQVGTLMDIKTFVSSCLLGIDYQHSTAKAPVTHLMSFDRDICAHGNNIHPFRYGQPFLDVIYHALNTDSRGISSAQVRFINSSAIKEPVAFFNLEWLLSHEGDNQVSSDELYPPKIIRQWLSSSGNLVESEGTINLLEKPYSKNGGAGYKDVNLRTERWASIEEYFPEGDWAGLVENIYRKSVQNVELSIDEDMKGLIQMDCLSYSVVIIARME